MTQQQITYIKSLSARQLVKVFNTLVEQNKIEPQEWSEWRKVYTRNKAVATNLSLTDTVGNSIDH